MTCDSQLWRCVTLTHNKVYLSHFIQSYWLLLFVIIQLNLWFIFVVFCFRSTSLPFEFYRILHYMYYRTFNDHHPHLTFNIFNWLEIAAIRLERRYVNSKTKQVFKKNQTSICGPSFHGIQPKISPMKLVNQFQLTQIGYSGNCIKGRRRWLKSLANVNETGWVNLFYLYYSWCILQGSGEEVTIFILDSKNSSPAEVEAAKACVKRLKTLRHPNILTFLDSVEVSHL